MDNFNEGGAVHRSNIIYPPKNRVKGSYEDCEDQVEYNSGKNLKLAKIFNKSWGNLTKDLRILYLQMFKSISNTISRGVIFNII